MANYSYPLPMPDPPPSTTNGKPTSSRALPTNPSIRPRASHSFKVDSRTDDPQLPHVSRDSRFDDAFEEPGDVDPNGQERSGGKVETMRDFLASDEGFQPRRQVLGGVQGNASRSQVTTNRLSKEPSPAGKRVIPLRGGKASIRSDDSSGVPRDQRNPPVGKGDRHHHHQGSDSLQSRIEHSRSRIPDVPVVAKKKSILDFAAHLAHKPKPSTTTAAAAAAAAASDATPTKPRTVFPKFHRRKPQPSRHEPPSIPAPTTTTTTSAADESTVSSLLTRESIDSSYSIISEPDASSFALPVDENLWGEQDGGVVRRVGKKKSFAAAGGILGKIFRSGEGVKGEWQGCWLVDGGWVADSGSVELRHEESTATLRPGKTPTQSLRDETRPGTANEPEPTSPTSSIESFQSSFPDHPHASDVRGFPPTYTERSHQDTSRLKSPALPTFHFTRPSYSGTNFRVDLADAGADFPPVPPVPSTFANRAPMKWERASAGGEMTRHEAPDESQASIDRSRASSLVHVEHALGGDDDYSLISGTSVFRDRDGRRHSGKLPWRRSIQGVFMDRGDVAEGIKDRLPSVPTRETRPSGTCPFAA